MSSAKDMDTPLRINSKFKSPRPGVAFKNGKLYIFAPEGISVIRQWPDVRGWYKCAEHDWKPYRPELPFGLIRLEAPGTPSEKSGSVAVETTAANQQGWEVMRIARKRRFAEVGWLFSHVIPPEIRQALKSYHEFCYDILVAFCSVRYSIELHRSNPGIFYGLVRCDQFQDFDRTSRLALIRSAILWKQPTIAAFLGFPQQAANSAVKVLRSIPPRDLRIWRLKWLRQILTDPELCRMLTSAPVVTGPRLDFLWRLKDVFNRDLLSRFLHSRRGKHAFGVTQTIARDMEGMAKIVDHPWPPQPKIRGINAMESLHADLMDACNRRLEKAVELPVHEDAPQEIEEIQLLRSSAEVRAEGREMHHCVASYIPELLAGEPIVISRVLYPERATARLAKIKDEWCLVELRGNRNAPVRPETWRFVQEWLRDSAPVPTCLPDELSDCPF
jgi:hypothetical protein